MKVLVIAPHPDDETLCCAGTIMNFIERGDKVKIIIVTDGRYGTYSENLYGTEELVRIRKEEATKVFEILGVKDYDFLGFEDSKVSQKSKEVEEKLSSIIKEYKPDVVFAPSPCDLHPDHSEIGKIILKLFPNAYFYLIWGGEEVKFDIKGKREKKIKALEEYKSQMEILRRELPFEKFTGDKEVFYKVNKTTFP